MPDIVRVKDPISGAEYDVPRSRLTVCHDLKVLDKPTGGRPKSRQALGTPAPGSKAARKRSASKRTATKAATNTTATEEPPAEENDGQTVATEKEND